MSHHIAAKIITCGLMALSSLAMAQEQPPLAPAKPSLTPSSPTLLPQGVYTQIDTRLGQEALRLLSQGSPQQQQHTLERVRANPGQFQPPVLYVLSQVLFKAGRHEEAAFWFYAGQLRARFDANRCTDATAAQVLDVMNKNFGPPISRYLFQDLEKASALITRVVEWDRRTPYSYDPRWINLHGMQAVQAARDPQFASKIPPGSLSLPSSQWPALAEQTRSKYLQGYLEAIAQLQAEPRTP